MKLSVWKIVKSVETVITKKIHVFYIEFLRNIDIFQIVKMSYLSNF